VIQAEDTDCGMGYVGPPPTHNPYTGEETFTSWQTPQGLFDYLDGIYHFQIDAAADATSAKKAFWYGPDSAYCEDALAVHKWYTPAWCNPPYGKGIEKWLEKFVEQSSQHSVTTVALLPARTESRWWAKGIVPYASVIFLTGRVPFVGPDQANGKKSQPDHPSALCIYQPLPPAAPRWWDWRKDVEL
jgi:phage N-6-adenine-methyltransferase